MARENDSLKVLGLVLAIGLVLVSLSLTANRERNTIDVSGDATLYAEAKEARIWLTASTRAEQAADAQRQASAIVQNTLDSLTAAGITRSSIETVSINLQPVEEYNESTRSYELIGYEASHTLRVSLNDTAKAGTVIDAAVDAGIPRIDSISFGLPDADERTLRGRALELASADAKAKAERLAASQGLKIVGVASISEGYANIYAPQRSLSAFEIAPSATEVLPGQIEIRASVSASYLTG